jgi:hypothetical protein
MVLGTFAETKVPRVQGRLLASNIFSPIGETKPLPFKSEKPPIP